MTTDDERLESAIELSFREKAVAYAIALFGVYGLLSLSDAMRPPYLDPLARAGIAVLIVFIVAAAWRWQTR